MKFLRCYRCGDMVALRPWVKECRCGACRGRFLSDGRTVLVNPSRDCLVLGADNEEFTQISYMVAYRQFAANPNVPAFSKDEILDFDEEVAIIKRKWQENPELGMGKLLEWLGIHSEDEIPQALREKKGPQHWDKRLWSQP